MQEGPQSERRRAAGRSYAHDRCDSSQDGSDDEPFTLSESTEGDSENDELISSHYVKDKYMEEDGRPIGYWWTTSGGRRLLMRFTGQCNFQTDIKECTFLGSNDAFVACGSDDGHVFIYNSVQSIDIIPDIHFQETGQPVNILKADEDVCNCVQNHPSVACLATSGIESVVRLWSPIGETANEKEIDARVISNLTSIAHGVRPHVINAQQMLMRVRMILDNYDLGMAVEEADPSSDEDDADRSINCRMH